MEWNARLDGVVVRRAREGDVEADDRAVHAAHPAVVEHLLGGRAVERELLVPGRWMTVRTAPPLDRTHQVKMFNCPRVRYKNKSLETDHSA